MQTYLPAIQASEKDFARSCTFEAPTLRPHLAKVNNAFFEIHQLVWRGQATAIENVNRNVSIRCMTKQLVSKISEALLDLKGSGKLRGVPTAT